MPTLDELFRRLNLRRAPAPEVIDARETLRAESAPGSHPGSPAHVPTGGMPDPALEGAASGCDEAASEGGAAVADAAPVPSGTPAPATFGLVLLQIDDYGSYEDLFGDSIAHSITLAAEGRIMPLLAGNGGMWTPGRGRIALSLPGMDAAAIRLFARHLQRTIAGQGLATAMGEIFVTASAGCAVADEAALPMLGPSAERALRDAVLAGRGRCKIVASMAEEGRADELADVALRDLEARRITYAYQPARPITGKGVTAFIECLPRLPNEGGQPIDAHRFVPAILKAGKGPLLDRQVLERALDVMTRNPVLRLSVNVCTETMGDTGWFEILSRRAAVDLTLGERLIVEVDERSILEAPDLVGSFVTRVQRTGAAIAIDRFGNGALAPDVMRRLAPDIVKLDARLVNGIADAPGRQALVVERIGLARALDLLIVATAVERDADAAWLAKAGVTHGQGWAFARPGTLPEDNGRPLPLARDAVWVSPDRATAS